MADAFRVKLDFSQWDIVLDALDGPIKQSLARRMGVEGGVLLRDEAKRWVPTSVGPYNPSSRGSHEAETLRNAIYLAFDTDASNDNIVQYNVTWNSKKAWWGKLVEFGHHQKYQVYYNAKEGYYSTNKTVELASPKFIPPKPFLRPAYDIAGPQLMSVMIQRGRDEFPILMAEYSQ